MTRLYFVLILLLWSSLCCCSKKYDLSKVIPANGKLIEDVIYKNTPHGPQKLDLYIPNTTTNISTPVVVFIHGGSWIHGNKDGAVSAPWRREIIGRILKEGYAVISIDYRLIDDSLTIVYPGPLADCKDAIKWTKANAAQYHFDAKRIAVMGGSAGAHLAMLAAWAPDGIAPGDPSLSNYDSRVKCVVDIYGPTDLSKILRSKLSPFAASLAGMAMDKRILNIRSLLLWGFTGEKASHTSKRTQKCLIYSPLTYVRDAVPTIAVHGTSDTLVPFNHTTWLQKAMHEYNKELEVYPVDGQNHAFPNITEEAAKSMSIAIVSFLKKHI
ncbi:MAG: alpha/beta hydrolase [Prevotella sp.]|nr:alpha/beta hydrolase [Prevotella sp.]